MQYLTALEMELTSNFQNYIKKLDLVKIYSNY